MRGSSERYGETRGVPGLRDGVAVCGIAGDQQAALFGQACFAVGDAKCTYGTGAFMLMNTGARAVPSQNGLLTTVGWKLGDEVVYALEGSTFIAGAMVQWLREVVLAANNITQEDVDSIHVVDTPEEVRDIVVAYHETAVKKGER